MALTKPIKGIIGACLTPFDQNDRIDYKALEKEIEFLVTDCDAVTIAAVEAAEYTMLSRDERKELLKLATEMVGGRIPVILGCSSPSPREVIATAAYRRSGKPRVAGSIRPANLTLVDPTLMRGFALLLEPAPVAAPSRYHCRSVAAHSRALRWRITIIMGVPSAVLVKAPKPFSAARTPPLGQRIERTLPARRARAIARMAAGTTRAARR